MSLAPVLGDLFVLLAEEVLEKVDVLVELLYAFVFVLHFVWLVLLAFVAHLGLQGLQVVLARLQTALDFNPQV